MPAARRAFVPWYPTSRRRGSVTLEIGDLAVRSLPPGVQDVALLLLAVDDVAVGGDVTLLVEGDDAQHRVESLAGMHPLGHLLGTDRLCLLGGLLDDLQRSVAVQRVGLRLEGVLAGQVDHGLVVRGGAR